MTKGAGCRHRSTAIKNVKVCLMPHEGTGAGQQTGNAIVNGFVKESLCELKKNDEAWIERTWDDFGTPFVF